MPQVRVIPPISEQAKKLRVAAYARVSSDSADQLNSFATQRIYWLLPEVGQKSYWPW